MKKPVPFFVWIPTLLVVGLFVYLVFFSSSKKDFDGDTLKVTVYNSLDFPIKVGTGYLDPDTKMLGEDLNPYTIYPKIGITFSVRATGGMWIRVYDEGGKPLRVFITSIDCGCGKNQKLEIRNINGQVEGFFTNHDPRRR